MNKVGISAIVKGSAGALLGAVVGGAIAYYGAVHTTEINLEYERLSAAYASYVSSLAQYFSRGDLANVLEARAQVTLYGEADVIEKLARRRLPCEGDWFLKTINDIRSKIGQPDLRLETSRDVLCGPKKLTSELHKCRWESDFKTTCELHFSEQFPLSYVTLRDHALDVTNGDVREAQRLEPDGDERNRYWKITIQREQAGAVTIRLPKSSSCTEPGAICTALGKPLSNGQCVRLPHPPPHPSREERLRQSSWPYRMMLFCRIS